VGGRDRESLVVEFHLDSVGVEAREVGEHSDRLVVLDDIDGDLAGVREAGDPGPRRVERAAELLELPSHPFDQVFYLGKSIAACHAGQDSRRSDLNVRAGVAERTGGSC